MMNTQSTTSELASNALATLAAALEAGNSAALTAFLSVTARFHKYSWLCSRPHNADYIKLYNGDSAMLSASLQFIQSTAAEILAALEVSAEPVQ